MTAGASPADRERCLAAGMDDFLAKPVKPRDVEAALARWVGTGRAAGTPTVDRAEAGFSGGGQVLVPDVLEDLRQLTPDGSLLVQIVDTFVRTAPAHVAELRAAVATGDAAPVRQAAHRLRGAAGALGASEVARLCTSLEEMSVQGRLDGAPAVASAIEAALGRATADLRGARDAVGLSLIPGAQEPPQVT